MKINLFLLSCMITVAFNAAPALAAEQAESKGSAEKAKENWRKEPPKLPAPRPFKLPEIEQYKLGNGLSVELVEDHRVPFTTMAVGLRVGTVNDPPERAGLSSMLVEMLSEGSKKRSSKEIAEAIDFIGGGLGAQAGQDFTVISSSALSQYNERLLETVSDLLLNPSFPEDELKLKKTNKIQELSMSRSKPDFLASERFAKTVFGAHPYSVVAPEPKTVEKITRQELIDFHKQSYFPNRSELVVVGDFKKDEMKSLIEKYFSAWKQGEEAKARSVSVPKQSGRKIYLVHRPDSVQSKIKLGNLAIRKSDPDFYAMTVANQVLGGAATSRLFINIRENKGYTYGAYSRLGAQKEPGSFAADAEVRSEVTAAALQEFLYELDRIRNLKAGDKELADTKNYLVGSFQLGLETQSGLAQRLLEGRLYDLPSDYLESYAERIMAVGADDVRRVSRKYMDLDNLVVTVVGDADKIKADLEYFAPVSIYDTSGQPLVNEKPKSRTAGGG